MGPCNQSPSRSFPSTRHLISQTQPTQQTTVPLITRTTAQLKASTTNRLKNGLSRTPKHSPTKIKGYKRLERKTSSTILLIKEKPLQRPTRTCPAKIQRNTSQSFPIESLRAVKTKFRLETNRAVKTKRISSKNSKN